jgi:hypothetical protein
MVEQAAFDRNLFQSEKGSPHVNLRFPEFVLEPTYIDWLLTASQDLQHGKPVQCIGRSGTKEYGCGRGAL